MGVASTHFSCAEWRMIFMTRSMGFLHNGHSGFTLCLRMCLDLRGSSISSTAHSSHNPPCPHGNSKVSLGASKQMVHCAPVSRSPMVSSCLYLSTSSSPPPPSLPITRAHVSGDVGPSSEIDWPALALVPLLADAAWPSPLLEAATGAAGEPPLLPMTTGAALRVASDDMPECCLGVSLIEKDGSGGVEAMKEGEGDTPSLALPRRER
mmetsp:Transcript_45645/g.128901  ORF Transcript_45645/g.128901 Transcript_45645/m.128901 type:complete len:208 (+) Transcript_45645:301-924(+)